MTDDLYIPAPWPARRCAPPDADTMPAPPPAECCTDIGHDDPQIAAGVLVWPLVSALACLAAWLIYQWWKA